MTKELLMGSLFNLKRALARQLTQKIKEQDVGLAPMHVRSMKIIRKQENCTANIIVELLSRDKAQVARLVNELLEKELVNKEANPNDKRSQFLLLTDKGKVVLDQLRPSEREVMKLMTHGIDDKTLEKFTDLLQLMTENLRS